MGGILKALCFSRASLAVVFPGPASPSSGLKRMSCDRPPVFILTRVFFRLRSAGFAWFHMIHMHYYMFLLF